MATIGIDSYIAESEFDGQKYKFKILDTAGAERFDSIVTNTIKFSDGFLLVFSLDKKETLERIKKLINNIDEIPNRKEKVIFLVGNKIDRCDREITYEEAFNFAKEKNMKYFETSAKTGYGVGEVFDQMFQDIYELYKKLEEKNNQELKENINVLKEKETIIFSFNS